MVSELQQSIAVWAVLLVPFVLLATHQQVTDELPLTFVAAYWFPAAVLTFIGVLPAPWSILEVLPG
ncbi:hypothetical protein SAMN05216226_102295 [Halovenus aranensis]|jgi:predicted membrane-bound mannosyltransferase|uniref:Uncharacterized protein n=1 Tax=Halovenus aranensis TaxID=890420 RepID=A0A1G8T3A6_9EURY|nr:hypothetical protein [Halovenus aranensis]SDJ35877.1 hypothetical protein SAMN05216226_102295 [Halovenus aranensis]